jgi:ABC-type microcin C transport system permease subunit YejE
MSREEILASLMAQAREEGAELVTLRAIVEEASALATDRALERLGLGDPSAQGDLGELRELLQAWRDAKTSAWKALIEWLIRGLLALLLVGIAVRLGVWKLW